MLYTTIPLVVGGASVPPVAINLSVPPVVLGRLRSFPITTGSSPTTAIAYYPANVNTRTRVFNIMMGRNLDYLATLKTPAGLTESWN